MVAKKLHNTQNPAPAERQIGNNKNPIITQKLKLCKSDRMVAKNLHNTQNPAPAERQIGSRNDLQSFTKLCRSERLVEMIMRMHVILLRIVVETNILMCPPRRMLMC